MSRNLRLFLFTPLIALAGCVAPQKAVDYTAFRESRPASIVVLPPLNTSIEPQAAAAVLSQATRPLAESGYYVTPVAVMAEMFQQNGLVTPDDIHALPVGRLRNIFGADAALYLTVSKYGSSYAVLSSAVTVSIDATLVDLRTGTKLWEGKKELVESSNNSGGGLVGMLLQAVVDQIVNTLSDKSYGVAGLASEALVSAGPPGGLLPGPRSPRYTEK